jgi:rubrerythrin
MWECDVCGHRFVPTPYGEQRCPICLSEDVYPEGPTEVPEREGSASA